MHPLLTHSRTRALFLMALVGLLLLAPSLVGIKYVVAKMLPFDNKSEFQAMVNAP